MRQEVWPAAQWMLRVTDTRRPREFTRNPGVLDVRFAVRDTVFSSPGSSWLWCCVLRTRFDRT